MTLEDYSLTAFTVLNGGRIVAYLPQILCVHRDRTGASSVSMTTWGMFFSANLATVFYALTVTGDRIIAGVFALNAIACIIIFSLILRKRIVHAWRINSRSELDVSDRSSQFIQFKLTALLARARRSLQDRLAAPYTGASWSDAIERSINEEWRGHLSGRAHRL
jgi:hypothetical protein